MMSSIGMMTLTAFLAWLALVPFSAEGKSIFAHYMACSPLPELQRERDALRVKLWLI